MSKRLILTLSCVGILLSLVILKIFFYEKEIYLEQSDYFRGPVNYYHTHDKGVFFVTSTPGSEKFSLYNFGYETKNISNILNFQSNRIQIVPGSNKDVAVIKETVFTNVSVALRIHYILDGEYKGCLEEFSYKCAYKDIGIKERIFMAFNSSDLANYAWEYYYDKHIFKIIPEEKVLLYTDKIDYKEDSSKLNIGVFNLRSQNLTNEIIYSFEDKNMTPTAWTPYYVSNILSIDDNKFLIVSLRYAELQNNESNIITIIDILDWDVEFSEKYKIGDLLYKHITSVVFEEVIDNTVVLYIDDFKNKELKELNIDTHSNNNRMSLNSSQQYIKNNSQYYSAGVLHIHKPYVVLFIEDGKWAITTIDNLNDESIGYVYIEADENILEMAFFEGYAVYVFADGELAISKISDIYKGNDNKEAISGNLFAASTAPLGDQYR